MTKSRTRRQPQQDRDDARVEADQQSTALDSSSPGTIDRERLARRAYERFLMRGGEHGHDQEDWFGAEQDLKGGGE